MQLYREKIGIVGGFGAYATLDFYRRILEKFASETERNYPHIIMDNNFTMPSRTRALLYGEAYDEIVHLIANSLNLMLKNDVERIVLVCGTAHFFLPEVYQEVPEAQERVVDIIDVVGECLEDFNLEQVLIVAAEGALSKHLYSNRLKEYGAICIEPDETYYDEIRYFIECVKRNEMDRQTIERFLRFLDGFSTPNIVLGCTEFPVLVDFVEKNLQEPEKMQWSRYHFLDPIALTIDKLHRVMV